MRRGAGLLLAVFVAGGVLVFTTAGPAWACVCAGGSTDAGSFAGSDVVFVGTAIHGGDSPFPNIDVDPWTFRVESVQKGPDWARFVVHTDSRVVTKLHGGKTGFASSSCGYPVDRGRRYQIFADSRSGRLSTGTCSGSRELAALGRPPDSNRAQQSQPYWPEPGVTAPAALAVGALIALAAAARSNISRASRARP